MVKSPASMLDANRPSIAHRDQTHQPRGLQAVCLAVANAAAKRPLRFPSTSSAVWSPCLRPNQAGGSPWLIL